jgi:hypothetical protein
MLNVCKLINYIVYFYYYIYIFLLLLYIYFYCYYIYAIDFVKNNQPIFFDDKIYKNFKWKNCNKQLEKYF